MSDTPADDFVTRLRALSLAEWAAVGARSLTDVDDERGTVDVMPEIEDAGLAGELERLIERFVPRGEPLDTAEADSPADDADDAPWPDEVYSLRGAGLDAAATALAAILVRDRLEPGALERLYRPFEEVLPLRALVPNGGASSERPARPSRPGLARRLSGATEQSPSDAAADARALLGTVAERAEPARLAEDAQVAEAFAARLEGPSDDIWVAATALCLDNFSMLERAATVGAGAAGAGGGGGAVDHPALTPDELAAQISELLEQATARAGAGADVQRLRARLAARAERVDWAPLQRLAAYSGASRRDMTRIAADAAASAATALRVRSLLSARAVELVYAPFERLLPLPAGR